MATRHQARQSVVGLLYAWDMGNVGIDKFADDILEESKIRNKQKDFALELYKGVMQKLDILDEKIDKYLNEKKAEELGCVEKAILRLGVYELLFTKLDGAIIINEAIELAKSLGAASSAKFVNGVLDSVKKDLQKSKS